MSFFTKSWKFDGIQAAFVMRGSQNGRYLVKFEREFASLEDIEGINWAQPAIEHTNPQCPDEFGLPAGYGFTVAGITYESKTKSYTVELQVADQFLGDVTPYQEQIAQLESEAAEKDATIAEKEAAIKALEAAGTAETVKADLQAAYTEEVESNG